MFSKKNFTRKKQENSKNGVRPSKQRNLDPGIVPGDVDRFSSKENTTRKSKKFELK